MGKGTQFDLQALNLKLRELDLVVAVYSLANDGANCVGEFRTTFRTAPAPVSQWI